MRLYEQQRQDKQNQNMQDRQDYAQKRQDYMGAQAYDRFYERQDKAARLKQDEEELKLKRDRQNADNALRRALYESQVSQMNAKIGLERDKFAFTKAQYADLQQSRAAQYADLQQSRVAANALATRARAVIGSGY